SAVGILGISGILDNSGIYADVPSVTIANIPVNVLCGILAVITVDVPVTVFAIVLAVIAAGMLVAVAVVDFVVAAVVLVIVAAIVFVVVAAEEQNESQMNLFSIMFRLDTTSTPHKNKIDEYLKIDQVPVATDSLN
ncbi:17618_t:CDS:2, partial [Cetraspora pellucida]